MSLDQKKLQRYHHPSHPHKLFQNIIRNQKIFCDNLNCTRRILNNEVSYVCFRCNFDLCSRCFDLQTDPESCCTLHESDNEVDENVHFFPSRYASVAKSVRLHRENETDSKHDTNRPGPQIVDSSSSSEEDDEEDDEDEDNDQEDNNNNQNESDRHEQKQPHLSQPSEIQQNRAREFILTFHNENLDELTSDRINTFINNSRGEVTIRRHSPPSNNLQ